MRFRDAKISPPRCGTAYTRKLLMRWVSIDGECSYQVGWYQPINGYWIDGVPEPVHPDHWSWLPTHVKKDRR